ncbi:YdcF family protein [Aquabacter cavernae]|uniref:YdcF family protein n=1 Tax=Aquabacter cavernae TaxID=2496029 RepID=UPI0013DFE227|nr:YdcF family protein [Aquabacter cavernae]
MGGVVCVAAFAFLAGFALFTARIASREPVVLKPADGIVVLTGGASRVSDGIQLLAGGHGRRMLISGVNRTTSAEELRRTLPNGDTLLDCCVDLGRKALNTWGNAIEVAEWTRSRDFRSLVVVTSSWHMPRALFELGRMMPEVELISFPVVTDRMQDAQWWSEPHTAKLLMKEYVKYLMAHAKIRPLQAVAPTGEPDETQKPPPATANAPQAAATH